MAEENVRQFLPPSQRRLLLDGVGRAVLLKSCLGSAGKPFAMKQEEQERLERMLRFESELWRKGVSFVAGVDEAGMGPLAGPVVAAAVILGPGCLIPRVNDSKRLSPGLREELAGRIRAEAVATALCQIEPEEIDRLNIYRAGLEAMRRALRSLSPEAQHALVDGRHIPATKLPQTRLVKGDTLSLSIAAASILAKTSRDTFMLQLDSLYPGYGFADHKGYPTAAHRAALSRLGPCPAHRLSFPAVLETAGQMSPNYQSLFKAMAAADSLEELGDAREDLRRRRSRLSPAEYRRLQTLGRRRQSRVLSVQPLLVGLEAGYDGE